MGAALLAAVLTATAACTAAPTAPSTFAPFSQTDLVVGTGATAVSGKALTVNYVAWLYDSTQPDSKGAQVDGLTAFAFAIGGGSVIKGWDQGLIGMQEGGVRRLVIPPSLGYGGQRKDAIPPYATLIFEVTLLSVSP